MCVKGLNWRLLLPQTGSRNGLPHHRWCLNHNRLEESVALNFKTTSQVPFESKLTLSRLWDRKEKKGDRK